MSDAYDPAREGAKMSFEKDMSYVDYLALDQILGAQHRLSKAHDEMLFIIQHQTSELWMRLALFELSAARRELAAGHFQPAFKMLTRVSRIFEQLNSAWDVLRTMTPSEYSALRDDLGASSGFQSHQYRELEYLLGNKREDLLLVHADDAETHARLSAVLNAPSFYDEVLKLLARRGFAIPASHLERDWSRPYEASEAIEDAWLAVYSDVEHYWDLYMLAEKVTALEYYFQEWRFKHMKTVARVIGQKQGTGGSAGVNYLVKALNLNFFPELWAMRTRMVAPKAGGNYADGDAS